MENENGRSIAGVFADAMDESSGMDMDSQNTVISVTATNPSPNNLKDSERLRSLLTLAHQFLTEGKPSQALQMVMVAIRDDGGEDAVNQTLHRAREMYRNKVRTEAAADELASLFAECAIAEADPLIPKSSLLDSGGSSMTPDLHGSSILAKTGREQIMLDACSDGSSFICLQCGGLVSRHRREEHFAYWCSNI